MTPHIITPTSVLAPLLPSLDSIAATRGLIGADSYELTPAGDGAVLYAYVAGRMVRAWDIGPEAAPLQAQAAQLIADKAAADEAARIAAEANPSPEVIWWQKLNGTITDATTGIEISASESVRNILTGQLVLVSTALQLGAIQPSTPQDIWDVHGVKHTMPASELTALILRHGIAWAAMFAEFAP